MNTFNNNKTKRVITTVLLCVTGAVGLLFAILGADRARRLLAEVTDFIWYRFKGFLIGCLILLPIWLLWWIISSVMDKVSARRAREAKQRGQSLRSPASVQPGMRPVCPVCRAEVIDAGRFCRNCGWDFTRPLEEAREARTNSAEQSVSAADNSQGGETTVEQEKDE